MSLSTISTSASTAATAIDVAHRIHSHVTSVLASTFPLSWFDNCDADRPFGPTPDKLHAHLGTAVHTSMEEEMNAGTICASSTFKVDSSQRGVVLHLRKAYDEVTMAFYVDRICIGGYDELIVPVTACELTSTA